MEHWEKVFRIIQHNPILFLERYYNVVEEQKVELTTEQKQKFYDKYKGIPYFEDFEKVALYQEKKDKRKAEGKADWEL